MNWPSLGSRGVHHLRGQRYYRDRTAPELVLHPGGSADQKQAPPRLVEPPRRCQQVPGEVSWVADVGRGQVDHHHVAARLEHAERRTQPGERRVVQRPGGAHHRSEPAVLRGYPGHHDAPEVACADPEVVVGVDDALAEVDEDDVLEDDDVLLAGALVLALLVLAAAAA
jgi:hypothetical protein